MTSQKCPQCGKPAEGNFCSSCGAALGGRYCNQCGAEVEAGGRFCNRCGNPLGAAAASGPAARAGGGAPVAARAAAPAAADGNRLVWWVAGGALVGLLLIVAYPVIRQDQVGAGGAPVAGSPMTPGAGPSSLDLSTMTPRDAADRLYVRVMSAAEQGDSTQALGFLPMAISAYEMVNPLDADGHFHVALLKEIGGDFAGALEAAREGLEDNPDHLLNLAAAGRAALGAGDEATAREYYGRLLDVWDAEEAKQLEEYSAHRGMLPQLRQEAEAFLGG